MWTVDQIFEPRALAQEIKKGIQELLFKANTKFVPLIQGVEVSYTPLQPDGVQLRIVIKAQVLPRGTPLKEESPS